jgi:hypothetical protein
MRKRIVIGAIVAVVLGVVAYVTWQSGTPRYSRLSRAEKVEWHKAKYMNCFNRMHSNSLWERAERTAKRTVGIPVYSPTKEKQETEARSHLSALVALGYLAERRYVITNRSLNDVLGRTLVQRKLLGRKHMPLDLTERIGRTNELVVVALPDVVSQYDEMIRKADMPESKQRE